MDLNSPAKKRMRPSGPSDSDSSNIATFYDTQEKIKKLVLVRRDAQEIINEFVEIETSAICDFLKKIRVELRDVESFEVPQWSEDVLEGNHKIKENLEHIAEENRRQMQLLKIMQLQKKCPISRAIANI